MRTLAAPLVIAALLVSGCGADKPATPAGNTTAPAGSSSSPATDPSAGTTPNAAPAAEGKDAVVAANWDSGKVFVGDQVLTLPIELEKTDDDWLIQYPKSLAKGVAAGAKVPTEWPRSSMPLSRTTTGAAVTASLVNPTGQRVDIGKTTVWAASAPASSEDLRTIAQGETEVVFPKGIKYDVPEATVIAAYGKPTSIDSSHGVKTLVWTAKNGNFMQVQVFAGRTSSVTIGTKPPTPGYDKLVADTAALAPKPANGPGLAMAGKAVAKPSVAQLVADGWTLHQSKTISGPTSLAAVLSPGAKQKITLVHPDWSTRLSVEVSNTSGKPAPINKGAVTYLGITQTSDPLTPGPEKPLLRPAPIAVTGAVTLGMHKAEVVKRLGPPPETLDNMVRYSKNGKRLVVSYDKQGLVEGLGLL